MGHWKEYEIALLRSLVRQHFSMRMICQRFMAAHDRDSVVEAIDALRRHTDDLAATQHVNRVLGWQCAEVPLINGKPAYQRPAEMF